MHAKTLLFLLAFVALLSNLPPSPAHAADEMGNYVIIVPDNSYVNAVSAFKAWKEQLGFTVRVVPLPTIYGLYTGDNAERIWQYLHDRFPPNRWGIRYVLLVGDLDLMPMRMLYPDGSGADGGAYGSDFYYANLSMRNWDLDDDNRWGEFTQDHLDQDYHAEVLVGRIPFSNPAIVQTVLSNTVAFEQDISGWKRQALLAHGIMDYGNAGDPTHADTATLAQRLIQDFFTPFGWTVTTQYETGGIFPTAFTPNQALSQTNFENLCTLNGQGVVNVVTHGAPNLVSSLVWAADLNGNGVADGPPIVEWTWNDYSEQSRIAIHPTSGIVFLCGCETGAIVDDPNFFTSILRSRYLVTATRGNLMVKEYLEHGAPVVIASTAGSDYAHHWDDPADGMGQSLNYYFYQHLIDQDQRAGDAFYAAQEDYARKHGLQRGIRVFNYFGDPSLMLRGVENRPGGLDTLVKEGSYRAYAADNAEDGTMYVAVLASAPDKTPGFINIYRSTDHGQHWSGWTWVEEPTEPILDVATLVATYEREDKVSDLLHVFYTTPQGRVVDVRINRADPNLRSTGVVANAPHWAVNISAARTPVTMPGAFDVYIAWAYTDTQGTEQVRVYRSRDNGDYWVQSYQRAIALMPHVEAGPNSRVHLSMLADNNEMDVLTVRSLNGGETWESTVHNLTVGDGALQHAAPVVALSNDTAAPGVWVAYGYEFQDPVWGSERDLRFAYSPDGGQTWTPDRRLSSDAGVDEWLPDLAGSRGAPNRWVNIAFNTDPRMANAYQRNVVWRWTSGGLPVYWAPQRIVNDHNGAAPYADRPVIVYSPGAAAPGSGIVYGGANRNNLYFSAPWLAPPVFASVRMSDAAPEPAVAESSAPRPAVALTGAPGLASGPTVWQTLGTPAGALAVTALVAVPDGALYAAAVTSTGALQNAGRIFRSTDGGQTWQPLGVLADCWSATSLLRTGQGTWLAGGLTRSGSDIAGVVYRSTNGGQTWSKPLSFPGGAVYRLVDTGDGTLWATTGWRGQLFKSIDDGQNWTPVAERGAGTTAYDLLRTGGVLLAAVEQPGGGQILRSVDGGSTWTPVNLPGNVSAVYALAEAEGRLYAGVRVGGTGRICEAAEPGINWSCQTDLPGEGIYAVRTLTRGRGGEVIAGIEKATGRLNTQVFLRRGSEPWAPLGGAVDLANAVYALTTSGDMVYAGTGLYGHTFRVQLPAPMLYLPLILK